MVDGAAPDDRAGPDARADRAGAERLRRRRARRLRPAFERGVGDAAAVTGVRHPPPGADGRRAVRRLGADVPDLQRHPQRRPRGSGWPASRRPRPRSRRSAPSGASTSRCRSSTSKTMEQLLGGSAISYFTQLNVREEIVRGLPRRCRWRSARRSSGWCSASRSGCSARCGPGGSSDRLFTFLALVGVSLPVFWLGALLTHYLGFKAGWFPNGGYVPLTEDPLDWAYHLVLPCATLARPVRRLLLARSALERARDDERGLRPDGAREGAQRAPGAAAPRAAQLADPGRDALGARLRRASSPVARSSPRRSSTFRASASTPPSRSASSTCRRCSR